MFLAIVFTIAQSTSTPCGFQPYFGLDIENRDYKSAAYIKDLEWHRIQEAWVARHLLDTQPSTKLEDVLPGDYARYIRMLGCPTHACRELAMEWLSKCNPEIAQQHLIWGTFLKDKETSSRCLILLLERVPKQMGPEFQLSPVLPW